MGYLRLPFLSLQPRELDTSHVIYSIDCGWVCALKGRQKLEQSAVDVGCVY